MPSNSRLGILEISKLVSLAPRAPRVPQRLLTFSNPSFRYHVPRRIEPLIASRASHVLREAPRSREQPKYNVKGRPRLIATVDETSRTYGQLLPRFQNRQFRTSQAWHDASTDGKRTRQGRSELPKIQEELGNASSAPPPNQPHTLMERLHLPQFHRPTKEELLAAATGFWSRLRVRFKWMTIRSLRPYNLDEIIGFFTWILFGHVLWLVIGTTTFLSLAILGLNTVLAQETLAGWVGSYLTKSSGLKVVFESAIVPKWGDGVITFKNVFVSRRPGQKAKSGVSKGSPEAAAIAASVPDGVPEDDGNYTQFDITIGEINVTLSFRKWWNSKGLLENVEVKHVRGVVDRSHVHWSSAGEDPKSYRHEHQVGDFEIDAFKIEDLLVSIHQPNGFRPFTASVYNADLPRLRKQWLFYDLLSANSMTGEVDKSIFAVHPRQLHSLTGAKLDGSEDTQDDPWKKQSRIRVDGLNIDHLNRGVEGPFGWIHEGNVDIIADIMIPNDTDESAYKIMTDLFTRLDSALAWTQGSERGRAQNQKLPETDEEKRFLVMDLRIHLNDVRAVVPLFPRELSYVNSALIRPIVAYINSRRTFIPVNCRVVKRAEDFDGSWTIYDSGLMNDLSAEVYDAFARDVMDEQARMRRFKQVGLWSLQVAVQAIFMGMAGNLA